MTRAAQGLGLALLVAGLGLGGQAVAAPTKAPATDFAALQQQINTLRGDYEAKIAELEARLKAAEAEVAASRAAPPTPTAPEGGGEVIIADSEAAPPVAMPSQNAMNPGVSVVLNGNYVARSGDPSQARIPGFPLSDNAAPERRGFSLGESEVTLGANVDPYLSAALTVSFDGSGSASVEEGYIQTTALPAGLTLKAGRFYSAIGYLNERHGHNWSFIDMPLPYRVFLGSQYGDDGVQVRWLAPTPFFLEAGSEVFRGDRFPGGGADKNRAGSQSLFIHTGADINDDSSWLGALSYLHTAARDRVTGPDHFSGDNDLGIASLVYKWAPGGNPAQQNLTLSGEYFFDRQNGAFNLLPARLNRSGWYAQGVYQFTNRWSLGLRYGSLTGDRPAKVLLTSPLDDLGHNAKAITGLLEYDTSEFARFRMQITHDQTDLKANDELRFQYTVVYGPHGAHRY
ncbi:MAG: hypothetical protein CGW95_10885 [Phenylobacterium zucineum]|nr:MAG: hypothetical protein CGW95_10885 [Phenylobacterium zucineum]